MDSAVRVPGVNARIGLDGVIGLLPVGGGIVTGGLSLLIVWEARRLGVSRAAIRRMLANVAIETAADMVPIVGDLFDIAFKANLRNVALAEEDLTRQSFRTTA